MPKTRSKNLLSSSKRHKIVNENKGTKSKLEGPTTNSSSLLKRNSSRASLPSALTHRSALSDLTNLPLPSPITSAMHKKHSIANGGNKENSPHLGVPLTSSRLDLVSIAGSADKSILEQPSFILYDYSRRSRLSFQDNGLSSINDSPLTYSPIVNRALDSNSLAANYCSPSLVSTPITSEDLISGNEVKKSQQPKKTISSRHTGPKPGDIEIWCAQKNSEFEEIESQEFNVE